jgi:hypothetical protein
LVNSRSITSTFGGGVVASGASWATAKPIPALNRVAPNRQLAMLFIDVTLLGPEEMNTA